MFIPHNEFDYHLNRCKQCRDNPFNLCLKGIVILTRIYELEDDPDKNNNLSITCNSCGGSGIELRSFKKRKYTENCIDCEGTGYLFSNRYLKGTLDNEIPLIRFHNYFIETFKPPRVTPYRKRNMQITEIKKDNLMHKLKSLALSIKTMLNPYYVTQAASLVKMSIQDLEDHYSNYPLPEKEILILATAMAQNNNQNDKADLLEKYLDKSIEMENQP